MWDSAIRNFFLRLSPWSILLCTSLWMSNKPGRTHSDKVQWFSPIRGKQLACDCGQSMCHAELDELTCELVTSGARTNEEWEFSAAPSGGNSIPDGSGAPWCMFPQHRRFTRKPNQPGRNPGGCTTTTSLRKMASRVTSW